jgi:hypothetical protein
MGDDGSALEPIAGSRTVGGSASPTMDQLSDRDGSENLMKLLPVMHIRNTEAFKQGQRDREQGWPMLDWMWELKGELLLCYRQGYERPRVRQEGE